MPPYSKVSYRPAEVTRAFAREGVVLAIRSHGAIGTTLGNRRDVLEVDVFADPHLLKRSGFHDLVFGPNCAEATRLAEQWRGNVRVIVNGAIVDDHQGWVDRARQALALLPANS